MWHILLLQKFGSFATAIQLKIDFVLARKKYFAINPGRFGFLNDHSPFSHRNFLVLSRQQIVSLILQLTAPFPNHEDGA